MCGVIGEKMQHLGLNLTSDPLSGYLLCLQDLETQDMFMNQGLNLSHKLTAFPSNQPLLFHKQN